MTTTCENLSLRTGTFISPSPVTWSVAVAGLLSLLAAETSHFQSINASAVYSGVFDLLAIFTGFLATFYVFVVTKGNRFLESIRKTVTFDMVVRLLKFTIIWSVGMILFSYLMMVISPKAYEVFSWEHGVVFFWIFNAVLISVNFGRCVRHFVTIAEAGS